MQTELLELAKQGNPQAIATLMNQALRSQGVMVKATLRDRCLHLLMESAQALEPAQILPALRKAMSDLSAPSIASVRVYARHLNQEKPIWSKAFSLNRSSTANVDPEPSSTATEVNGAVQRSRPIPATATPDAEPEVRPESTQPFAHPALGLHRKQQGITKSPLAGLKAFNRLWLLGGIAGLVTLGGGLLWGAHVRQAQTLAQAEVLIKQIGTSQPATNLQQLETQKSQLQRAIVLLEANPQDEQAQKQLATLQTQLNRVANHLVAERQAETHLKLAQQQSDNAEQILAKQTSGPQRAEAIQKLKTAITLLEVVPPTTFVSQQVQKQLGSYRQRFNAISSGAQPQVSPQAAKPPIRVALTSTGVSWLQVTIDGTVQYEGSLTKPARQTWTAKQRLTLRVGDAGNILASFNGATAQPLGKPGDVLEVNYEPQAVRSQRLAP